MAKSNKQERKSANKQSAAKGNSSRGFASMDPARQREIASEGGKVAHERGTAHEFNSEEARRAGSKSHGTRQGGSAGSSQAQESQNGSDSKRGNTGKTGNTGNTGSTGNTGNTGKGS
jgi:hypothetical protein